MSEVGNDEAHPVQAIMDIQTDKNAGCTGGKKCLHYPVMDQAAR